MSDDTERAGLGKVVYNVDEPQEATQREDQVDEAEVKEADEESFPASDPPGFAGGTSTQSD
jgi:hypothetical protein